MIEFLSELPIAAIGFIVVLIIGIIISIIKKIIKFVLFILLICGLLFAAIKFGFNYLFDRLPF
jgi:hypothetical protein